MKTSETRHIFLMNVEFTLELSEYYRLYIIYVYIFACIYIYIALLASFLIIVFYFTKFAMKLQGM